MDGHSPLLNPASAYAARDKNKAVLHYPMQIGVCGGGGGGGGDVGCRGTVASLICGFQDVSILCIQAVNYHSFSR